MENLLKDLKELGLPVIHNYSHGFYYSLKPTGYEVDKELDQILKFKIQDCGGLALSFYDAELTVVTRPSNLIIQCEKCYEIIQKETGGHLGYIYWQI